MKTNYLSSGRTKQKTETRNRILKQAQTLLSAGNSFSLDDIANESGISRATVYRYYSSIDVLVAEAGLDIKTLQPEHLFNRVSKLDTTNRIIKIQNYFNELALKNEEAFRKYLGTVLNQERQGVKRGARRVKSLQLALKDSELALKKESVDNLINTATILMGIEAMITARDVCGLSKEKSKNTLQWALEIILQHVLNEIK